MESKFTKTKAVCLRKSVAHAASLLVFMGLLHTADVVAEGPAVAGMNGKISAEGGDVNNTSSTIIDGVIAAPLGHSFGVQVDGSTGRFMNADFNGLGGHLFWRDPEQGLVGITSSNQKLGNIGAGRDGLEAEAYLTNITLRMRAGEQSGDIQHGGFVGAGARWYVNENLALSLGYDSSPGLNNTGLGVEWQPALSGLPGFSVFAHGDSASGGNNLLMAGVRFYFDGNKSLIQRHRTSDPDSLLMGGGSNLSDFMSIANKAAAACQINQHRANGVCVWNVL